MKLPVFWAYIVYICNSFCPIIIPGSYTLMQWNCRGVISKWAEVKPMLLDKRCDAICLQETHFLPSDRYDFNLQNYTLYNEYADTGRRQGGVCIYLSNKWPHYRIQLDTPLQAVACSTRIGPARLTICSLYLPPNDRLTFQDLNNLVTQLPEPFIISTDANSRHILWGADRCDSRGNIWEQLIRRHAIHVLNNGNPTRLDEYSGLWSHIDITLCSSSIGQYTEWVTDDDLHSSDHCPIYVTYSRNVPSGSNATPEAGIRWNLDKANWTEFTDKCKFTFVESAGPENCTMITEVILNAAKQTVPQKSGQGKYNCPWWTDECEEAKTLRNRALNRFRRSRQHFLLIEYKRAKAKARQVIRKAKKESWTNLISQFNHTTPVSRLWDIIRRFTKKLRFQRPLPVLKVGDHVIDDPLEVGNSLGQFFSDMSSSQNYRPAFRERVRLMAEHVPDFSSNNDEIYNCDFTLDELNQAVTTSGNTSVGPDSLHYAFFKHMTQTELRELLKLFNYHWRTGIFPSEWRHSTLIPILKPGKPGEKVESYRPIQLTSCMCKLMERMIAKRLSWFVTHNNMISKYQSAFTRGRSTADHLVRLDSEIRRGFFYHKYTLATFLDLKNAYNLTSTTALLSKMHALGFRGRLMSFIQGYLQRRTFQVKNGVMSDIYEQENGLVQGGVISPILFNIMINDIFTNVSDDISVALFADDCSMWVQGRRILPLVEQMQAALNQVSGWTDRWGFTFSPQKCNAIIFRRYMQERELVNVPNLTIYDQTVEYTDQAKFLGVLLDTRMNLKNHVDYVRTKALKRIPLMKCLAGRGCGADRSTLLLLYKSMIRPILEYACQILDGPANKIIDSLEAIQNACVRIATGALRTSPIMPMLIESDIYPLALRRSDLTIRYCLKARSDENHPCYILTTDRSSLHTVDRNYMKRISGFPLYERLKVMCREMRFILPGDLSAERSAIAPWKLVKCRTRTLLQEKRSAIDKTAALTEFYNFRREHDDHEFIFTDGSKTPGGVGCAFVWRNIRRRFKLPDQCSIFTAEAMAILQALRYVAENALHHTVLCTDSLSAVMAIRHATSEHPTLLKILEFCHQLTHAGYDICILWIPGHCNIAGNEIADAEAKLAVASEEVSEIRLRYTEYYPTIRQSLRTRFDELWTEYQPNTNLKAIKDMSGKWATSVRTNRREEVTLCRLRLGHTRLTHSYIIDRAPISECDRCRQPLNVRHILIECPVFANHRTRLSNVCQVHGLPLTLKSLLGNDHVDIIDDVFTFLRDCELLKRL